MPRLRHTPAQMGAIGQCVALDDRDLGGVVRQDTRGYQAGHTASEDECRAQCLLLHPSLQCMCVRVCRHAIS
jgi:hypothetical protein